MCLLGLYDDYMSDVDVGARVSCDKKAPSQQGWKLLNFCKATSLRICNGRLGTDNGVGNYTFHSTRGSSVVDYVLCYHSFFCRFSRFDVAYTLQSISDHSVVSFSLNICTDHIICNDDEYTKIDKYIWDSNKIPQYMYMYVNALSEQQNLFDSIVNDTCMCDSNDHDVINSNIAAYVNILHDVSKPLFMKTFKRTATNSVQHNNCKGNVKHYDDECRNERSRFLQKLNRFRVTGSQDDRQHMVNARNKYKTLIRRKKRDEDMKMTQKLYEARNKR